MWYSKTVMNFPKNTRIIAYLLLLINTVIWGSSLVLVKPALEYTTTFRFLFYRFLIASILSLPIIFYYFQRIKNVWKNLIIIFSLEILGTSIALAFLYSGLNLTSALEASFLATITPIFIVVIGVLVLKEKEEKKEALGLILAFIGTVMLTVLPMWQNGMSNFKQISLTGNLLVLGHNISTAFYFVLARKYYKKLPKFFVSSVSFVVGMFSFLLLSIYENLSNSKNISEIFLNDLQNPTILWPAIFMAVFSSIIALTAYIKAQDYVEASEASIFWYLQPVVFIPLAYFWLNETISPAQIFSVIVICAGVYLAEARKAKK